MMIDGFVAKLLLSFLIGGSWITCATIAAERLGSKVGGFLGGLPSTIVVTMFFIAWTQGSRQAFDATTVLPLAFGFNAILSITYVVLVRRGLAFGLLGALLVWLVLQALVVWSGVRSFALSIAVGGMVIGTTYYLMEYRLKVRSQGPVATRYTLGQIVGRALFSGGMTAGAVLASRLGGPIVGGIFAAFPALTISALTITARSVGVDFSRSLVTPLMVSGSINCVVFGTAFRYAVIGLELPQATVLAYGLAVVSAFLTYVFIQTHLT